MKFKLWNALASDFIEIDQNDIALLNNLIRFQIAGLCETCIFIFKPDIEIVGVESFNTYVQWCQKNPG
jgi:hypothetical protein